MFPFDTSPFYSAPASYFVVECGAHINLAVQPAGSFQQATKVCNMRPKLHKPDVAQAYREKMCTELLAKHPKECALVKTYREPCTLGEILWAQGYVYFWAGKGLIYALHNSQFALVSFTAIELHYAVKHTQNIVVEHIELKGATVTEHHTCALIIHARACHPRSLNECRDV